MSTEFFNDQWRIPSNENQNKVSNYSMDFDGTNDVVNVGTKPRFTGLPFTWSFWIYPTSSSGLKAIYSHGLNSLPFNQTAYFTQNNTVLSVYLGSTYATSAGFLTLNQWQHVVATRDSSNVVRLYRDGVVFDSAGQVIGGNQPAGNGYIGAWNYSGGTALFFEGKIDQGCVFDYALSQDQVTQLGADGYAFNFIPNDRILFGDVNGFERTDSFSLSLWANIPSYTTNYYISKQLNSSPFQGYNLFSSANGKLQFILNNTFSSNTLYVTSTSQIPQNQWVHLTLTYDGSSSASGVNMYLNGVSEIMIPVNDTLSASTLNTTDFQIAGRGGDGFVGFGDFSNVSIFNTELTSPQVTTLYNNGKPSDISSLNPIGWWKLDDTATFNSGTSVWSIPDDSTNSNTGASVGMDASSLVASNINGELIANPMATSPKPIAYYQLGDQSVSTGPSADYLVPNNSLQDYVFSFNQDTINIANGSIIARQQNISYSAWVNADSLTTTQYIAGNSSALTGGTGVYISNTGAYPNRLVFQIGDPVNFSTQSYINSAVENLSNYVNINEWFHVAASWDGTTSKIYINGIERSSWTPNQSTNTYTISGWKNGFVIGRNTTNVDAPFSGELSNIAFWNTDLTPAQVTTLYNNGTPGDISSLSPVSWWKLNAADTFDGTNWTISDYAGSNDGTSFGMTSANLVQSDLSFTSGYSPYALDFDGVNDELNFNNASANIMANKNTISISGWFKLNSNTTSTVFSNWHGSPQLYLLRYNTGAGIQWYINSGSSSTILNTLYFPNVGDWVHVVAVKDPITNGGQSRVYVNGIEYTKDSTSLSVAMGNNSRSDQIGVFGTSSRMNGSISNVAYWTNTALTQAQVTEIYNQGVPSNLNTFSGTSPDHWLQLGSNSSYNPNPTGTEGSWTCLDEIGTNNAVSDNSMTNDAITNGVGYSANGLGSSTIDIVGDAPYSTANGLSENMDVLDRVTDVPS